MTPPSYLPISFLSTLTLLLLCLTSNSLADELKQECEEQQQLDEYKTFGKKTFFYDNQICYIGFTDKKTWDDARDTCRQIGETNSFSTADLATIHDGEKRSFLTIVQKIEVALDPTYAEKCEGNASNGYWLGGHFLPRADCETQQPNKQEQPSKYFWVTSEHNDEPVYSSLYQKNEPNDQTAATSTECCLEYRCALYDGSNKAELGLNNKRCSNARGFVCEQHLKRAFGLLLMVAGIATYAITTRKQRK